MRIIGALNRRRGASAVTLRAGVPLLQLHETLAWLATEPDAGTAPAIDVAPVLSGISVTPVAYDQLTLGDADRAAEASASQGSVAPVDARARIGEQLNAALNRLGASSFGPVIRALGDRSTQQRFVSQVADVLPVSAVANWLHVAAEAQEQQLSHHMLRLMSKLSTFADERITASAEQGKPADAGAIRIRQIESTRLIQMALEYTELWEENSAVTYIHDDVSQGHVLPMAEVEAIVHGLAATVAYEQHIWFDGQGGYPHIADPRATQYASRIVHVCDVDDALCSKRPDRDAWSRERALTLIESIVGTELAPGIATAFVTMVRGASEFRVSLDRPIAAAAA